MTKRIKTSHFGGDFGGSHFERLPNEIIYKILDYTRPRDYLKVELVCKLWYKILNDVFERECEKKDKAFYLARLLLIARDVLAESLLCQFGVRGSLLADDPPDPVDLLDPDEEDDNPIPFWLHLTPETHEWYGSFGIRDFFDEEWEPCKFAIKSLSRPKKEAPILWDEYYVNVTQIQAEQVLKEMIERKSALHFKCPTFLHPKHPVRRITCTGILEHTSWQRFFDDCAFFRAVVIYCDNPPKK
jgi:hypothetical protein